MPDVREKLVELLCEAHSKATDAEAFTDATYAQQLEMEADHLIRGGVTIQRWIPVAERLPEEGDRYLCRIRSFAFPGSFYRSILRYDKYGFSDGGVYEEGVTHWMPLPEPPKEEE